MKAHYYRLPAVAQHDLDEIRRGLSLLGSPTASDLCSRFRYDRLEKIVLPEAAPKEPGHPSADLISDDPPSTADHPRFAKARERVEAVLTAEGLRLPVHTIDALTAAILS